MALVSYLGCNTSHGAGGGTCSADLFVGGIGVTRIGDAFNCPIHGAQTWATTPNANLKNDGKLVMTIGGEATCGAILTQGYADWNAS